MLTLTLSALTIICKGFFVWHPEIKFLKAGLRKPSDPIFRILNDGTLEYRTATITANVLGKEARKGFQLNARA